MVQAIFSYFFGACFGLYLGFIYGVKSEKFDRAAANLRLQQCLEVIKK